MVPLLLGSPKVDFICVQEPWINPYTGGTYCPRSSGYYPVIQSTSTRARACLLVNQDIDPTTWDTLILEPDLVSIRLRTTEGPTINITSAYLEAPTRSQDPLSLSQQLQDLLGARPLEEHLITGDFNLHHPSWGGPACLRPDSQAQELLELTGSFNLTQALPIGTITREDYHSQTTIDLVWTSPGLSQSILGCQTSPKFTHGSDHLPILTELLITPPEALELAPKPAWRKINQAQFLETLRKGLPRELGPQPTTEALDSQAEALTSAIQAAIQTIPHQRPCQRSKSGWTPDCSRAVSRAKALRRRWQAYPGPPGPTGVPAGCRR